MKKKENEYISRYYWKIIWTIVGLIMASSFIIGFFVLTFRQKKRGLDFDRGWKVTIDSTRYSTGDITDFAFPVWLQKKNIVILHNKIPQSTPGHSTICLLTYLSTVEVYIDGNQIYSYGKEAAKKNQMVGSGYQFIDLPDNAAGKTIEIILRPQEKAAFTNISGIEILKEDTARITFAQEHMVDIFIGVFLFSLGGILAMLSMVASVFNSKFVRLILISVFSFFIGIWSLCSTKSIQIFSTNLQLNTTMEYMGLYLTAIPFVFLMIYMRPHALLWKKRCMWLNFSIIVAFVLGTMILHFLNVLHFPMVLSAFHILVLLSLFVLLIAGWEPLKEQTPDMLIFDLGLLELCVAGGIDLVRFNVQKYILTNNENLTVSVFPFGTVAFIVLLLISYIVYLYREISTKAEKDVLTRMAYHDALTGLYNRAKWEEMSLECDRRHTKMILLSMDLNFLKRTNDTYGHEAGDQLLQEFAKILEKCFGDIGTIIRMGGDEFLVIVTEENRELKLKKRKRLPAVLSAVMLEKITAMEQMEMAVSKNNPFAIEAAYGMAGNQEQGLESETAESLYQTADKRMYAMKKQTKKQRQ